VSREGPTSWLYVLLDIALPKTNIILALKGLTEFSQCGSKLVRAHSHFKTVAKAGQGSTAACTILSFRSARRFLDFYRLVSFPLLGRQPIPLHPSQPFQAGFSFALPAYHQSLMGCRLEPNIKPTLCFLI
jgi:hypothetical protein